MFRNPTLIQFYAQKNTGDKIIIVLLLPEYYGLIETFLHIYMYVSLW